MPRSRRSGRRARTDTARNRILWDRASAQYDRKFERVLGGSHARAWGFWRIPEDAAHYLGPVRGLRTLEVGCGGARWSIALRARGARPVGLDLSLEQLARARGPSKGRPLPLLRGSAEALPFEDGSFDLVFCDWGALTFADPYRSIPECARVLRPNGRLVFSTSSPFRFVTMDRKRDRQSRELLRPYFGLHRIAGSKEVEFTLPYGEWIRLFRESGLAIERLVETRAPTGAKTPYLAPADSRWGRSWPLECVWTLRKEA